MTRLKLIEGMPLLWLGGDAGTLRGELVMASHGMIRMSVDTIVDPATRQDSAETYEGLPVIGDPFKRFACLCPVCGGRGVRFVLPEGVNPFRMSIGTKMSMGRITQTRTCTDCRGTGLMRADGVQLTRGEWPHD